MFANDGTRITRFRFASATGHADLTTSAAVLFQSRDAQLDENQILEFSMLVGHYVMAAMMLDVAGCEVEPAFSLDTR